MLAIAGGLVAAVRAAHAAVIAVFGRARMTGPAAADVIKAAGVAVFARGAQVRGRAPVGQVGGDLGIAGVERARVAVVAEVLIGVAVAVIVLAIADLGGGQTLLDARRRAEAHIELGLGAEGVRVAHIGRVVRVVHLGLLLLPALGAAVFAGASALLGAVSQRQTEARWAVAVELAWAVLAGRANDRVGLTGIGLRRDRLGGHLGIFETASGGERERDEQQRAMQAESSCHGENLYEIGPLFRYHIIHSHR